MLVLLPGAIVGERIRTAVFLTVLGRVAVNSWRSRFLLKLILFCGLRGENATVCCEIMFFLNCGRYFKDLLVFFSLSL